MQAKMTIEEFLNTCELKLLRAEGVSRQPEKLHIELIELEELLRNQWPDAIMYIKDSGLSENDREMIEMIFEKIRKLEAVAASGASLFDGMDEFMQRKKNR
jgi:hypothetical protein